MKVSIVTPVYNEAKSLPQLFSELTQALASYGAAYEIIAVDDASKDDSFTVMKDHAEKDPRVKAIRLLVNGGQTAALQAGIDAASGDIIILIDSDLENDPNDIAKLIAKIDEGYDVVSGWRQDRWKGGIFSFFKRKLPSMTANFMISRITRVKLHDIGCTLKAYKKEVIKPVELYGEMHRFIPFFAKLQGARITEVPVNYRNRMYGQSNYGISRTFRVLLDLMLVKFLDKYFTKPMHFFGRIGFYSFALAAIAFLWAFIRKLGGTSFIETPLPVIGAMFLILSVMLLCMGVLAEILMRTYFAAKHEKPYKVKESANLK
jgi:glycosyltransferase involved in cell wall biosynthesis